MEQRPRERRFSRGRWQIERERCRIADADPPREFNPAVAVAQLIPALIRKLEPEQTGGAATLEEEWPAIVGSALAAHTRPGRLETRRLVIFVDHSARLSELARGGHNRLLAALQARYGTERITSVRFALDPEPRPPRS
jgi:predicted nucleic acid-binding Zn ribbon protein